MTIKFGSTLSAVFFERKYEDDKMHSDRIKYLSASKHLLMYKNTLTHHLLKILLNLAQILELCGKPALDWNRQFSIHYHVKIFLHDIQPVLM